MSVSPAGVMFLLSIILLFFVRKNQFCNLFLFCLICETFFRKGYVFAIGESYIKFDLISEYVLILYCILHFRQVTISKNILKRWEMLMCAYIIPMLLLVLMPSSEYVATHEVLWDDVLYEGAQLVHPSITPHVIMMTLKWSLFSLVFLYVYSSWVEGNYRWLIGTFSKISNRFIAIGVLEFVVKNIFRLNEEWGEVLLFFWGESEATVYEARLRGGAYELTLFTQEASHYALVLTFICIIKMANNIAKGRKKCLTYIYG